MKNISIRHDCKEELRNVSLKATPARIAIMQILEKSDKPIDVTTIISHLNYQKIKSNPATVFRILNSFFSHGLVKQIHFNETKSRYELSSKPEHHHLICTLCGIVKDISDCNIDTLEKEIEKKKRFIVQTHSLEFFGICPTCQR